MKNNIRVTVGIPAYNEGYNIDNILRQVIAQKQKGFFIEKIIVVSDGSTDKTVRIAKKYINHGVEVIDGKKNRGQSHRQNEIISKVSSDVLVLLNADLLLKNNDVILNLIEPIRKGADLSAQWANPISPKTFIARVLSAGFNLKYFIYTHHKKGNNIYTCVGHIRALSRKFYSHVTFPLVSYGEDQYLYLTCIRRGYEYKYVDKGGLYFKLPETLDDYIKYAKRIFQTQQKFGEVFSEQFVKQERFLPFGLLFRGFIYQLEKEPFHTALYIILHTVTQQWALRQPIHNSHVFETSSSTKSLMNTFEFAD